MENGNAQAQAGAAEANQTELTEEEKAAKAEQEANDAAEAEAKAKAEAETAAASDAAAADQAKATGTEIVEGSEVVFTLAIGQIRDAVVRSVNGDGTLNVAFPVTDEDLAYLREEERDLKEVVRIEVKLGELGKEANTWSPKGPAASDQAAA